jgi:2',3'-cyclic-nucleotide 2'-phosphodiesterase (5'-nucleotidase family)
MKKILLIVSMFFILTLSACVKNDNTFVVDCEKYPNHVDCFTEDPTPPKTCEDGYVLNGDTCQPEQSNDPITCEDGYVLENDKCVFDDSDLGDYIDIYYLNDLHGALDRTDDHLGIAYIANLVNTRKTQSPDNVLFLAGGDMLQGSAISNYYDGLSTITLLNESNLDAFTIGNHEFDWGIETILQYKDDNPENGEANFPFLGANIFKDSDNSSLDGIDPYTIIEKNGHRIGIIGTMGYGLEHSIAESKIAPYYFANPVPIVANTAEYLRSVELCDVVIVVAHDPGTSNDGFASLEGDQKIDAIFNGHSHQQYITYSKGIPIIQSGSYGKYLGHLRLTFDENNNITYTTKNLRSYDDSLLTSPDPIVQATLDSYHNETDAIFNDPIIVSLDDYSSYELSDWLAHLMRVSLNADVAFHNYGGTRTDINNGEDFSLGKLYAIWPFDNVIKTVWLDGSIVNNLLNSGYAYNTDIQTFYPGTLYLVATNDYVFDKTTNPFINGEQPTNTGIVLRDLVESELTQQASVFDGFKTTNQIQTSSPDVFQSPIVLSNPKEDLLAFLFISLYETPFLFSQ